MKNIYIVLLALVWLSVGPIRANAATDNGAIHPGSLAAAPTFTYTKTDVTQCNGQSTGSISVTASGGTGPYQYSKDNGATFQSGNQFAGLTAGTYQIVVSDATNTPSTAQPVTISQPTGIEGTVTSMTQTCPGTSVGAYSVTATGGTAPYQYSLDNGTTYQTSTLFTGLSAGFYPLAVKDANGCVVKPASYQLTSSVAPTITPQVNNVSCNGLQDGYIIVDLSGGVDLGQSYASINNGTSFTTNLRFNSLGVGTYQVVVKYGNNCLTPVQSVSVTQPSALSFSPQVTGTINCNGNNSGIITVTASGGTSPYQYSKDNGNTYQDNGLFGELPAGTYQIAVKDANGCTAPVQSVVLSQPAAVTYTITQTDVSCFGGNNGSVAIVASGGEGPYEYTFSAYGPASITNPGTKRVSRQLTDRRGAREASGGQYDNLVAQTYYFSINDVNGCYTSSNVTINQPSAIVIETSTNDAQCNGSSSGSITVIAEGGTPQYTYSRDNGATFQNDAQFTGLSAGTYTVLVKDANTCLSAVRSVEISQAAPLTFSFTTTDATCAGGNTGSIEVTGSGGFGEYQYSRDNGATYQSSNPLTELAAGVYSVVVKDGYGCVSPAQSVTVGQPSLLTFTTTKTDVTDCFGYSSGAITVSATGGTGGGYLYSKDNGVSFVDDRQFNNLEAGTYPILVKDGNGCLAPVQSVVLTQPAALSATATATPVSCAGGNNGTLTVQLTGGTAPYRYSITDGSSYQTSNQFTGLAAGSYHLALRDASNCFIDGPTTEVTQPDSIVVTITPADVACFGGASGNITLRASGGTAPYQYSKDNGATYQTSSTFTNLGVGTYAIVVKDASNCVSAVTRVTLTQPSAISLSVGKTDVTTCLGSANGSISLMATGGRGEYQYSKDNGATFQTSNTFANLPAGTYTVVVKDANGCMSPAQSVTITQPTAVSFSTTKADVSGCYGNSTGSITLSATGGTAPYQYSNDNGVTFQSGNQFTNLFAGTYGVVVKDASGCLASVQSVVLTQPAALSATATATPVSCAGGNNGTLTVQLTGGTAPYRYSITDGSSYQTSNQFTGLAAGSYHLALKDANNCFIDGPTTEVTQPDTLLVNVGQTNEICFGGATGSITLSVTGGTAPYQYSKDNGVTYQTSNTFTNLSAGTYAVVVKDANNCVTSARSITVVQPAIMAVSTSKTNVTTCSDGSTGSIQVTVSGGTAAYQYSRDNGATFQTSNTFATLSAGTYAVVVKDANGCVSPAQSITITQPTLISFSTTKADVSGCYGNSTGSISVAASGGTAPYQYSKDNGATFQTTSSFTGLSTGTYQLLVKDVNGCVSPAQSTTISQPTAVSFTAVRTDVSCFSGSSGLITVNASGGTAPYQYSKDNGASFQPGNQLSGLSAGTYAVVVKDANGCVAPVQSVTINQPTQLSFSSSQTNISCFGASTGSISITASGGTGTYQYSKDNGSAFQVSNQFSGLSGGTYPLVVKDANGCLSGVASVTLSQPIALVLSARKTDIVNCASTNTGIISLSATGGTAPYQYSKDNGANFQDSPQFAELQAGVYSVLVKDANGCQAPASVTVSPACCLTTAASPDIITNGQSSTLTASGCSGTVSWVGGPIASVYVVAPTQTTTYTAVCSISGGSICQSEVVVTVNQPNCGMEVAASPTTITAGESSTLTATGCQNGTISWTGGPANSSIYVVSPTRTSSYTATCTIATSGSPVSCSYQVTVTVIPVCTISIAASSTIITNGQSVTLTASGCPGAISWSGTAQEGPIYIVNPNQTTTYTAVCTLSESNTCTSQVTVTVNQPVCNLATVASPTTITNGQSATLTASGCSGTITWTNTEQAGSSIIVSPSITTTYIATCSIPTSGSPVSCTSAVTVTVAQPVCSLTTAASPATITNGQSATLTASGCTGAISWVGSGQEGPIYVVNPTQTTTYTAVCTLSASNTCTSQITVVVTQPVCNLTTAANPTTITNGQSATLMASGCSGTVSWVGGPANGVYVVSPTQTSSYTAICSIATSGSPVTCSSVVTVIVTQPVCNLTTSASPTTITSGQSATLTASGCSNGSIRWTNTEQAGSSIIVSPLITTTYIATCSIPTSGSPVSCTSAVTVTVAQPICSLTTSASPATITNGQSATLTASGCTGAISWVGSGQEGPIYVVNPTQTTTYTAVCTLSASNTCTSQITVVVTQPVCNLTTAANPTTITNGQSATLMASGCSGTVSWVGGPTNGVYVVSPTQTSSYTAICSIATSGSPVTCSSVVNVVVNQPPCNLTTSASPTTITNGQSTTLAASGCSNGSISWVGGPTNSIYVVNPAQTTSYTAICSIPTSGSPATCISLVTVTVNQPVCTLAVQANPTTIFNGQRTTLTASGCANGTITWNNSQQIGATLVVSPTITTVYTASCTISTSGSPVICTAPVTVTVIARPDCSLQVQNSTPTIFAGSTASLTATGCSGSVDWNTGQLGNVITVNPAATASYSATCTINTAAGSVSCLASATVTVIARPVCDLSVQANPAAIFTGQSTTLTASGCNGGTVTWGSQQSGSSIVVMPTVTTTYSATCTFSTAAGSVSCTAAASVSVTQPILQIVGSSDVLPLNAATWIGTVTQNIGAFVWQYKTAGGDWVNFPSTFTNRTPITVSATSFLGSAASSYINQSIQLRALSPVLTSNVLTVTIRQQAPTVSSLTTAKAICSGSSTGSFSLGLSRGLEAGESAFQARVYSLPGGIETLVASYTFTSTTFSSPNVFGKGAYRVRIHSIVGTQTSDDSVQDFSIDDNPPITLSATKTDVLCVGGKDGTISLVASGGTAPYQFSINGGAYQVFQAGSQHQVGGLVPGTYTIQLRDANACQSSQPISVTITQPTVSLTITSGIAKNPSGFQMTDGSITLQVAGGTPDYNFNWSAPNPVTTTQPASSGVTHTISALGAGIYTVVITDKAGCSTSASYTLTQPTQLQARFTVIKAISCAKSTDGIVLVDASGGLPKPSGDAYTYSWKVKGTGRTIENTSRLTNAGSATFIVTVTDGNGVSADFEFFLPEPLPLVATVESLTNASCFGVANGSASVSVRGGIAPYAARWNTQQTGFSLTNLQAGRYLAVITDANACQAQVSVQIQQPVALTATLATADPSCYDTCDGRITAALAGGVAPYTVVWQTPVSNQLALTGLCSGAYSVSVTDASGCTTTQTATLKRPVQKQIVLRANTFICKGQTVDLDATIPDGVTYVWKYPDGSTKTTALVSVTAAGTYQVVATDKNGCVATAQITLTASETQASTLAFAVGSTVGLGESLIAVNLTNPRPAQSSWTIPAAARLISSTEDQLVVTFNQLGTYPITLNGQQGQCEYKTTKMVTVVADPQLATNIQTSPYIQELTILPNPSSGEFKVRIVLAEIGDVKIKVKPLLTAGVDIYQQSASGKSVYELSVSIPIIQTGIYLLTLETAKAIESTKLLIAR